MLFVFRYAVALGDMSVVEDWIQTEVSNLQKVKDAASQADGEWDKETYVQTHRQTAKKW